MTKIVKSHFVKFISRTFLFIAALVLYIISKVKNTGNYFLGLENNLFVVGIIWAFFAYEVIIRFFPSKHSSPGCQKHLKCNFAPVDGYSGEKPKIVHPARTFICAFLWILLNAVIFSLYFFGIIDKGVLILVFLAYSVCDIICILFFCPFKLYILGNKCCTTCRIYNWDYAMMFTPFLALGGFFGTSLLSLSLVLLFQWEIAVRLHPERFSPSTNKNLSCKNCSEKLCAYYKSTGNTINNK